MNINIIGFGSSPYNKIKLQTLYRSDYVQIQTKEDIKKQFL